MIKFGSRGLSLLSSTILFSMGVMGCNAPEGEEKARLVGNETGSIALLSTELAAQLTSSPHVLFQESFDNGGTPFSSESRQFAETHSFQVVTDPLSSRNKAGRFELRDTDSEMKGSMRTEVGFRNLRKEKWYSYSVYFPTSGFSRDSYPEIISQWHQEAGGSPPNALQVENDQIYFRSINRSDTRDNSNSVYTNYPIASVVRGKWHQVVMHFIHSPHSDGLIEIWFNGKKLHTLKGPNMRRDFALPNFKMGIYKWTWASRSTLTDRRVVYFDNIVVGNENLKASDFISGESSSEIPGISSFNLIQANTDQDLGVIKSGSTISTSTHKLNVRANLPSTFKGSVKFELRGPNSVDGIDDSSPYSVMGDDGKSNYYFGSGMPSGSYTLKATPILNGKNGQATQISFSIRN